MLFTRTKKGIGLIITHIQNDGMLRVTKAGGIRAGMYPGHKVVIHGYASTIYGAVIPTGDKNDVKPSDLIIDIGAKSSDEARKYVQEGDPIHFHTYHEELLNGRLCARAIDDRGGAFIILEALKRAKERGCKIGVYAATTVGEETTMRGAHWASGFVNPNVAIVVDVTYAQDYPGADPNESGMWKIVSNYWQISFALSMNIPILIHLSKENRNIARSVPWSS